MGWTVPYDELLSISALNNVLVDFFSFKSLLITSFHVFLGHPLEKLPLTLKVLHLLDQALFYSSYMTKPLHSPVVKTFPHAIQF